MPAKSWTAKYFPDARTRLVVHFGFEMADEFTSNTFPFRFTIPPASLDPSVPRPGPYLFHGGGMQNPQYPLLSTNALQFCAYGDCECFAAGLPGLPKSVASSPFVETFAASCERNVVSFGEIRRESVQEKSLKILRLPPFFSKLRNLNLLSKRLKFHSENKCQV